MDIKRIIKLSRPRFWLYLAGTFALGFAFGITNVSEFFSLAYVLPFLLFLIPANIFIYGINDISDRDTDILNPKKDDKKELRVKESEISQLKLIVFISFILVLPMIFFLDKIGILLLGLFLFLGAAYSVNPFRFKAKPFLDFTSNLFYMLPGIIGYYISSGTISPVMIWVLGISWTGAMHLFSAIPDIKPDRKAGLITSAVVLGHRNSLLLCMLLWSISVLSLIVLEVNYLMILVSMTYVLIPLSLLFMSEDKLIRLYWYYPSIHLIIGMIFFFYAIIPKI